MTPVELKAALEQRGFHLTVWIEEPGCVKLIARLGEFSMPWEITRTRLFYVRSRITSFLEREFERILQGDKLMACIGCASPLLVVRKFLDEEETLLKWYGCRSPEAGPLTEILERCPGCGRLLTVYPPPLIIL